MNLIKRLFSPKKDKNLRHFLKQEFKEELITLEMPNVGKYQPGPRTNTKPHGRS